MMSEIEKQETALRRKYHAIAGRLGLGDEERKTILMGNFGVESSADLNAHQLIDLIHTLESTFPTPQAAEGDKWRKRVIAAVADYLQAMGNASPSMELIKGVACRAAGYECFNRIPNDRLKSIYNAFKHRSNDIRTVAEKPLFVTEWQTMGGGGMAEA